MAIPNDNDIQFFLMHLLGQQHDGAMHCNDAYRVLAEQFPQLTKSEQEDPYQNSLSHWANRVQFAVLHLRENGLVLHHTTAGGRGIWKISTTGRTFLARIPNADEMLKELDSM